MLSSITCPVPADGYGSLSAQSYKAQRCKKAAKPQSRKAGKPQSHKATKPRRQWQATSSTGCLCGTWDLLVDTFWDYLESPAEARPLFGARPSFGVSGTTQNLDAKYLANQIVIQRPNMGHHADYSGPAMSWWRGPLPTRAWTDSVTRISY